MSTGTVHAIFDVDCGFDDGAALLWAVTSGRVDVVAVSATWGNTTSTYVARNCLAILEAAGASSVPVHAGAAGPSGAAPPAPPVSLLMGEDGFGNIAVTPQRSVDPEPAAEAIVRLARARPGEIHLFAVAPLTTVAAALTIEPALPSFLADVTVMGGAVAHGGNITAAAEANVGHDPEAGAAVIDAFGTPGALASGRSPRLVPLDVTTASPVTTTELDALAASAVPGSGLLHQVWESVWPMADLESGGQGLIAHDLLAAMSMVHPELLEWELLPVAVDTGGGSAWGTTVVDRRARILKRAPLDEATRASFEVLMGMAPARWLIATGVNVGPYRRHVRDWLAGVT